MSKKTQAHRKKGPSQQLTPNQQVQDQTPIREQIHPSDARWWARNAPPGTTAPADILYAQRTIGNQAVQRLLQASARELGAGSTTTAIQRSPGRRRMVFRGHARVRTQRLSRAEIRRRFRESEGGYFHHHGQWRVQDDVLTITFNPTIYLDQALRGREAANRQAHERRHYNDFRRRAQRLQRDVRTAWTRRGAYQEVADRWSWFLYDVCADSAAYHRQIGAPVAICMEPSRPRP